MLGDLFQCVCGQVGVIVVYFDVQLFFVGFCFDSDLLLCLVFGVVQQVVQYFFQICIGVGELQCWIDVCCCECDVMFVVYVCYQLVYCLCDGCYVGVLVMVGSQFCSQVMFDIGLYVCVLFVYGGLLVCVIVVGFGGQYVQWGFQCVCQILCVGVCMCDYMLLVVQQCVEFFIQWCDFCVQFLCIDVLCIVVLYLFQLYIEVMQWVQVEVYLVGQYCQLGGDQYVQCDGGVFVECGDICIQCIVISGNYGYEWFVGVWQVYLLYVCVQGLLQWFGQVVGGWFGNWCWQGFILQ